MKQRTQEVMKELSEHLVKNAKYGQEKQVYGLLDRLDVSSKMTTRPHIFACGTHGEVIDEITVKIKVARLDIQPHSDSEVVSVDQMVQVFADCEIAGWLENLGQE